MRFLHLSDLHVRGKDQFDQNVVVKAMLRDVSVLNHEDPFDFVVFSGDIAFSGSPDEFHVASEKVVQPLLDGLSLSLDRLIVIPGNHDVDVSKIDPYGEDGLAQRLTDGRAVEEFLSSAFAEVHLERLVNFDDFRTSLLHGSTQAVSLGRRGWCYRFDLDGHSVSVAALDSAWRASGQPDDIDKGRILVGESQVRAAVVAAADSDVRIAVMHHPLDWLGDFDANTARVQLEKNFDVVLTGHIHRADPFQVASTRRGCIYVQAGALFQGHGEPNMYSAISVADGRVVVCGRAYVPERDEFGPAQQIGPQGQIEFPLQKLEQGSETTSKAIELPYNDIVGSLVDRAQTTSVISDRMAELEARSLDDLLVAPTFLPVPFAQAVASAEEDGAIEEVDLKGVVESGVSALLCAEPEAGLTNALWWLLEKAFAEDARIPVYLHASELASGKAVKRVVRDALLQYGVKTSSDDLPDLVVAIDDVHLLNEKTVPRTMRFIRDHPHCVFILGTKGDGQRRIAAALKDEGIAFERAFLGPFGRRQLRHLLDKVAVDVKPHVDTILQCVVTENLPRTPFVMAALVSVIGAGAALTDGMTETSLLDLYSTLLLSRWGAPEDPQVDLDRRSREHILSEFAAELTRVNAFEITRLDAEKFVVRYFDERGWQGSAGHVLDDLIERRVLLQEGEWVRFRHAALHDLFIAKQMLDESEFMSLVLDDPLVYSSPIKHAAALKRNDEDLLQRVTKFGHGLLEEWTPRGEASPLFSAAEGVLGGRPGDTSDPELDEALAYEPPTEEHKDEMWDQLERRAALDQDDDSPHDLSPTAELLAGLQLWGLVLRNSELVPQVPLKAELLKEQLLAWARLADDWHSFEVEDGSLRELLTELREEAQESVGRSSEEDELVLQAAVRLIITSTIGMWVVGAVGTKKLATPLAETLDDQQLKDDVGASLLGTLLYAHIEAEGWEKRLRALFEAHGDHYVVRALSRSVSVHHYYMANELSAGQRKDIETLIAEITLKERPLGSGASSRDVANARSRIIATLRQRRLRIQHSKQSDVVEPYLTRDVTSPYAEMEPDAASDSDS